MAPDSPNSSSSSSSSFYAAAEDNPAGTAAKSPPPLPVPVAVRPSTAPSASRSSRSHQQKHHHHHHRRRGRLQELRREDGGAFSDPDPFCRKLANATNIPEKSKITDKRLSNLRQSASLSDSNTRPDRREFERCYLKLFGRQSRKQQHKKGHKKSSRRVASSSDSEEETSASASAAARSDLDEYLQVLSACPDLGSESAASPSPPPPLNRKHRRAAPTTTTVMRKKKIPVQVSNNKRSRTVSECEAKEEVAAKFALRRPCFNFPGPLRHQTSLPCGASVGEPAGRGKDGSDSSGADTTVVSDFSEDSLNRKEKAEKKEGAEDKRSTTGGDTTPAANNVENDEVSSPRKEEEEVGKEVKQVEPTRTTKKRLREMEAAPSREEMSTCCYETDTSLDSSMAESREASLRKFLARGKERRKRNSREREIRGMEEELKALEGQLAEAEEAVSVSPAMPVSAAVATASAAAETEEEMEELRRRQRGQWGQVQQVRSLSMELCGNFTDNEKVRFSYENLFGSASSLLTAATTPGGGQVDQMPCLDENEQLQSLPMSENETMATAAMVTEEEEEEEEDQYFSMPEPVQSLVGRFVPAGSSHDRFSPRPSRRQAAVVLASHVPSTSSPSTPTFNEFKPFPPLPPPPDAMLTRTLSDSAARRLLLQHRRAHSMVNCSNSSNSDQTGAGGGAGGAVGVTSMWIPVKPVPTRIRRPFFPPRRQMSAGGVEERCARRSLPPPVPRQANVGLARRVLLQQQVLLPSKAELGATSGCFSVSPLPLHLASASIRR